jgi:hypothetical protein
MEVRASLEQEILKYLSNDRLAKALLSWKIKHRHTVFIYIYTDHWSLIGAKLLSYFSIVCSIPWLIACASEKQSWSYNRQGNKISQVSKNMKMWKYVYHQKKTINPRVKYRFYKLSNYTWYLLLHFNIHVV